MTLTFDFYINRTIFYQYILVVYEMMQMNKDLFQEEMCPPISSSIWKPQYVKFTELVGELCRKSMYNNSYFHPANPESSDVLRARKFLFLEKINTMPTDVKKMFGWNDWTSYLDKVKMILEKEEPIVMSQDVICMINSWWK